MKYLILGDIHGDLIWNDIIEKENPDITIFLGDYVDSHNNISPEQQLSNLKDILDYANQKKVILLRGNHDLSECGYYWAICSGYDRRINKGMLSMKDKFLELSQWIYIIPNTNIVCSHAGITVDWLKNVAKYLKVGEITDLNIINSIEPCELFGFSPCKLGDYHGTSSTQPCTWIRPAGLSEYAIPNYIQIVGHTPFNKITHYNKNNIEFWCCDCLFYKQYLTIDNDKFIINTL
jgi:predicted phosphodiesterase